MRRIAITLFVAAAWPTIPSLQMRLGCRLARRFRSHRGPGKVGSSCQRGRTRSRRARALLGPSQIVNEVANSSDQPWIAPSVEEVPCTTSGRGCGTSVIAGSPIKSWLCFRPTTAHALPWLRPHPYVGPITGQFHCSPTACPQCEGAPACAAGTGCGKGLGGGRGCRNGDCVPPAEGSFPGYKFAQPIAPAVSGRAAPTTTSTSYKPSVPPTGGAVPGRAANRDCAGVLQANRFEALMQNEARGPPVLQPRPACGVTLPG